MELIQVKKGLATKLAMIQKVAPAWVKDREGYALRVVSLAADVWRENRYLQTCEPQSFLTAVVRCAEVGLEPNSPTNQAYIVPRDGKACLEIHGRGWAHMALNQGVVKDFTVGVVYEKDQFKFSYEPNWEFDHVPYQGVEDPGPVTHAYGFATMKDGARRHYVLNRFALDKMAGVSDRIQKGKNRSWKDNFEGMACAKVAKYYFKRRQVGLDPLMQRAVDYDDEADTPPDQLREADAVVLTPDDIMSMALGEDAPKPPPAKKKQQKAAAKEPDPEPKDPPSEPLKADPGITEEQMLKALDRAWKKFPLDKMAAIYDELSIPTDKQPEFLKTNPDTLKAAYEAVLNINR